MVLRGVDLDLMQDVQARKEGDGIVYVNYVD